MSEHQQALRPAVIARVRAYFAGAIARLTMSSQSPRRVARCRSYYTFCPPGTCHDVRWDYVVATEGSGLQYVAHLCIDHDARFSPWSAPSALTMDRARDRAFTHMLGSHLPAVPLQSVRLYVALRLPQSTVVIQFLAPHTQRGARAICTRNSRRQQLTDQEVAAVCDSLGLIRHGLH